MIVVTPAEGRKITHDLTNAADTRAAWDRGRLSRSGNLALNVAGGDLTLSGALEDGLAVRPG